MRWQRFLRLGARRSAEWPNACSMTSSTVGWEVTARASARGATTEASSERPAPIPPAPTGPVEGFLHKSNVLDTLGDDEQDTPCKLNK